MCTTCGCSATEQVTYSVLSEQAARRHLIERADNQAYSPQHSHLHDHAHDPERPRDDEHPHGPEHPRDHQHAHSHEPSHGPEHPFHDPVQLPVQGRGRTLTIEQEVLAKNQLLAERNRGWLAGREIFALNLMSSPGAGKTTVLERTLHALRGEASIHVIEGDLATSHDAERIRATGCNVVQINTGTGCHLDAQMLAVGLDRLAPPIGSIVLIENVGNLVCPALFDLGERAKVTILSVTEGEDKPVKYPHMFRASELMLLSKIDLLPYVRFDVERCIAYARQVNPTIRVFCVSAQTGEGMQSWYDWLRSRGSPVQMENRTP